MRKYIIIGILVLFVSSSASPGRIHSEAVHKDQPVNEKVDSINKQVAHLYSLMEKS